MKKKLGLDLDGVVYPWHHEVYRYLCLEEKIKDISHESFWRKLINREIIFDGIFIDNLIALEILYDSYIPSEEELETMKYLDNKYNIIYITSRNKKLSYVTKKWMRRYDYPNLDNTLFVGESKRDSVRTQICDYYVEDKVSNIKDLDSVTRVIVHKQTHNESIWGMYPEVDSIIELPNLLEELDSEF